MSNSMLYAVNVSTQNVPVGSNIVFNQIVRRFGKNVRMLGNEIVTSGAGYYGVNVNVTFSDTASGTATITLNKDGIPVPGASTTVTTGTAAASHSVSLAGIITRNMCCKESVLTVNVTGTGINVNTASISVEKI